MLESVMSWCSVHASQQTGLEITWKDKLKFSATVALAYKENSKLSIQSEGVMVTNEPFHVLLKMWESENTADFFLKIMI